MNKNVKIIDHVHALVTGKYGKFHVNIKDEYLGKALVEYGEYSEIEIAFLKRFLKPGEQFLDIGSHMGYVAIPLALHVGEKGQGYAFEPQKYNFEMLEKNIKENKISHLQAFNFGIAEEDFFADKFQIDQKFEKDFYNLGGIPFGNITHKAQQHEDDMKFVNLDDLKIKGPIRLIKIDVEGMEMSVLRGIKNLLERDCPVLYLEWENREKIDEYDDFLSPLGYKYIGIHMPKLYHNENYFKNTNNIYKNIVSKNVLFIHEDDSYKLNFTF